MTLKFEPTQLRAYFVCGTQDVPGQDLNMVVQTALDAGITAFQYRDKGNSQLTTAERFALGQQLRERLLDIGDKRRAAGAGQKALFHQLTGFGIRHHVGAQRRLDDRMETQLLQTGDDLSQLGIGELAGDGGGYDGVDVVFAVVLAFFNHVDDIEDVGFIGDGAEGTLRCRYRYRWLPPYFRSW